MRVFAALALIAAAAAAACGGIFRQYEYEEDMHLSLDGAATMYVNSSIAALDALRGASFDARPTAQVDRAAIREFFSSPVTRVVRVSPFRRSNRRFVHVRIEVADVRRLSEVAPFAWSSYQLVREGHQYRYRQAVGSAAGKDVGNPGWTGRELAAFRLHLPSKIVFHNSGTDVQRGNILVWEQPLADRLKGVPLELDARMETQSILYRTLWLFGATFVAVAIAFVLVIGWVLRRGAPDQVEADLGVHPGADT